jgi:CRP-like cAMP-binding protein
MLVSAQYPGIQMYPVKDSFNDAASNRLLAAMPAADWQRWRPCLEAVDLDQGQVLYEAGEPPNHMYFPLTAVVSLLYVLKGGASAEIALVGCEGMAGVSLFLGSESVPLRAVVQNPGRGLRLKAQFVKDEFDHHSIVFQLLLRHTQVLLTQMGQTLVCGRRHTLQQQLCRWLLESLDRLPGQQVLALPVELTASMLGASRAAVVQQIWALERDGLVRRAAGRLTVPDRQALAARSCGCYALMRDECDRLLGHAPGSFFTRH